MTKEETKFAYLDKVIITGGFYRGREGIIIKKYDDEYLVEIFSDNFWKFIGICDTIATIDGDDMELLQQKDIT